jgi:hypothetical protein
MKKKHRMKYINCKSPEKLAVTIEFSESEKKKHDQKLVLFAFI